MSDFDPAMLAYFRRRLRGPKREQFLSAMNYAIAQDCVEEAFSLRAAMMFADDLHRDLSGAMLDAWKCRQREVAQRTGST